VGEINKTFKLNCFTTFDSDNLQATSITNKDFINDKATDTRTLLVEILIDKGNFMLGELNFSLIHLLQ
jgi:hypothetical protein